MNQFIDLRTGVREARGFAVWRENRGRLVFRYAGLAAAILLIVTILLSPSQALFDEPYYVKYIELLHRFGLSKLFILNLPGSPGPLTSIVNLPSAILSGWNIYALRLTNALLLFLTVLLLSSSVRRAVPEADWSWPMIAMSVPVIWQMGGLLLSEGGALVFLALAAILWMRWARTPDQDLSSLLLAASLSGLALGVAGLGRQMVLAALIGPLALSLSSRRRLLSFCLMAMVCVGVVAPVFWAWNGVVPPSPLHVKAGLAAHHMLLSWGYGALFVMFLAPAFVPWKSPLIAVAALSGSALNAIVPILRITPMNSVVRELGPSYVELYTAVVSSVLAGFAAVFAIALLMGILGNRNAPEIRLLLLGFFCISCTPLAIGSNFASRYVAVGIPLLIIPARLYSSEGLSAASRLAAGSLLGWVSLRSYYANTPWVLPWEEVLRFTP